MSEPIRRSVRVACSPERAFHAFTAEIDRWWPASHRRLSGRIVLEAGLGGRFFEVAPTGDEALLGRVLEWAPPLHVAYSWYPGADVGPTRVDVRFEAEAATVLVQVTHSEGDSALGPEWPQRAQRFDRAWSTVLPAYAAYLDPNQEPQ